MKKSIARVTREFALVDRNLGNPQHEAADALTVFRADGQEHAPEKTP